MNDLNVFPKGTRVVLLAGCDGGNTWKDRLPINHCYTLREDSNTFNFMVVTDNEGSSSNGWYTLSLASPNNKMVLRQATPEESAEYERLGKPYDVTKANLVPQIKNNYPLY